MKSVLITGGAGFIGSSLAEKLLKLGYKVIIADNFNEYYDPDIKKRNILEIRRSMDSCGIPETNLKLHCLDIRDSAALSGMFINNRIDVVVHLAAMAGVRASIAAPVLCCDVNINGTVNILEECKTNHISKVVFASSSSVYGNNRKLPFSETDIIDNPVSPYAASKKAGELICHTYHHLYNMSIACLRFFTVYGPRQRPDLAIHKFAKLIMEDKPIPFYGDGSSARDYTYIDDIVEGIIKAIDWLISSEGVYEIFNLGESRTVTLNEMVGALESSLGKKAELCRKPLQLGDMDITFADVTKAKTVLGYSPQKKFEEGIEDFIRWLNGR